MVHHDFKEYKQIRKGYDVTNVLMQKQMVKGIQLGAVKG